MQNFDIDILYLINSHHIAILDFFMQSISEKWTWLPLYLLAAIFIWQQGKTRNTLWFLICIVLAVGIADITTSSLLKPSVKRYRPCHEEAHLPFEVRTLTGHCGGKYGFASSHAANFMAMAVMLSLFFRRKKASALFFACAIAVGYSRIYLGVHYPTDVLAGFGIGGIAGYTSWKLYEKITTFAP